ncbi:MAG: hypothetical protein FJ335_09085 [Sphingomonadales bacterium]|nr:hypothetical protein [Sphingomonadales bacterium]
MLRPFAAALAAIACIVSPVAQACICPWYQTQAEIDADGTRALAAADLIAEATVGDVSWLHRNLCRGTSITSRLLGFGQKISADRPITVHRVLKGRAGAAPVLIGEETSLEGFGCAVRISSCNVSVPSNQRTTLFLHREADGRYRALSGCEAQAIRNSRVGQALFKRAG